MLFRRRPRPDATEQAWQELAGRLGLQRQDEKRDWLSELLGLAPDDIPGPVLSFAPSPVVDVYVFSHNGSELPGRAPVVVTACLLKANQKISPAPWRATRSVHRVLTSLQASSSGGVVVQAPGDPQFSERVTLVAREAVSISNLLITPVRRAIDRALGRDGAPVSLIVGEMHLLLTVQSQEVAFDRVELFVSDLLTLYTALAVVGRR